MAPPPSSSPPGSWADAASHEQAALRPGATNVICVGHSAAPEALQGMEGDCILLNFEQRVAVLP